MTTTHELPLIALADRSTAYLVDELARLTEFGTINGDYHDLVNTLCDRHPEVKAAWEAWTDANEHLSARDRVLAGSVIVPVAQGLLASHPDLAFSTAARYVDAEGHVWDARCGEEWGYQWGYLSKEGEWCSYLNSISSINCMFGPLREL